MTGEQWANTVGVLNQGALSWYATITNKPVQSGQPTSLMRTVTGTDLGGGATIMGQSVSPLSLLVLAGILVAGVVLVIKR